MKELPSTPRSRPLQYVQQYQIITTCAQHSTKGNKKTEKNAKRTRAKAPLINEKCAQKMMQDAEYITPVICQSAACPAAVVQCM